MDKKMSNFGCGIICILHLKLTGKVVKYCKWSLFRTCKDQHLGEYLVAARDFKVNNVRKTLELFRTANNIVFFMLHLTPRLSFVRRILLQGFSSLVLFILFAINQKQIYS
jgi:hypothetical protein